MLKNSVTLIVSLIKQIRNGMAWFFNVNHKFIFNLNHGFQ